MAALNFPSNPSNGQTYTANNVTYVWNGTAWKKNIPSQSSVSGINTVGGVVGIANDLDVDGHTNLDNVSVAGVSTFSDIIVGSGKSIQLPLSSNTSSSPGAIYFGDTFVQGTEGARIYQNTSQNTTFESYRLFLKGDRFSVKASNGITAMIEAYPSESLGVSLYNAGSKKLQTNSGGITVTGGGNFSGIVTASSFSGDGSNLTGIAAASVVKQVREATSTGQSGTQQTYTDKVSLTVSGISNNSRMIVIASYTLAVATPFTSGRSAQGRCIKDGGSFEGEEIVNEYSGYGKKFYNILYDSANGAGSRTYKIQWRRLVQQTGYISNAKILAIELGIGP